MAQLKTPAAPGTSPYESMSSGQLSACFMNCVFLERSGEAVQPYAHYLQHLASTRHNLSIRLHTEPRRKANTPG